jgi:hypothetical protein
LGDRNNERRSGKQPTEETPVNKLSFALAAAAALVATAATAAQPAYPDNPDVIWKGNFEEGASSLSGSCSAGQNGFCGIQTVRAGQIQVVDNPVFEGRHAARFEVKYGDQYNGYSDSRSLITPPVSMWEDEGNERWYRYQVMWPEGWVGDYPKWDELGTPSSRSNAGSILEWHHDANGAVESGSAPLYIRGGQNFISMCLVDQKTSACREEINLAPLQRGHWHDFVMHAKWSSDPSVGYLEIWIDGVNVLPKHMGSNKYPNMRNYLCVGLYRNGRIGDPTLTYPNGTHVYGTDGAPGVAYVDGLIAGKTRESVEPPQPAPQPNGTGSTPSTTPSEPTTSAPTPSVPGTGQGATAGIGFAQGGGCSSTGFQTAWLALPLIGLFAIRRRRQMA